MSGLLSDEARRSGAEALYGSEVPSGWFADAQVVIEGFLRHHATEGREALVVPMGERIAEAYATAEDPYDLAEAIVTALFGASRS